jgi:hypothetical protein
MTCSSAEGKCALQAAAFTPPYTRLRREKDNHPEIRVLSPEAPSIDEFDAFLII